jgi:hypothetical protein
LSAATARAVLAALACALGAGAAAGAGAPGTPWQCSPTGSATLAPALAEAARDYLARVEAIYPYQVLGLVRAGERFYLLNSRDVEWGERTRLNLLALRLQASLTSNIETTTSTPLAPDAAISGVQTVTPGTAERRAIGTAPGGTPPAGGFTCLAVSRAGREGLTRTPFGEIVLAAGQSVHLVNPQEPEVAVEVRAAQGRPLYLDEIFQRSARAGIYAGLTGQMRGQPRPPAGMTTLERPGGTLIFRTASAGGSASVVSPPVAPEPVPVAVVPETEVKPAPPPVTTVAAVAAPVREEPAVPSRPLPEEKPIPAPQVVAVVPPSAPAPEIVAVAPQAVAPVPPPAAVVLPAATAVALVPSSAAQQTYDDYARAMKTLMALKRPGSVRSVSEMTYVHPTVEDLRARNR